MNRPITVILNAPQASGKTRHAGAVAAAFGCTSVVDDWDGNSTLPAGVLALTNADAVCPPDGAVELCAGSAAGVEAIVRALQRRAA